MLGERGLRDALDPGFAVFAHDVVLEGKRADHATSIAASFHVVLDLECRSGEAMPRRSSTYGEQYWKRRVPKGAKLITSPHGRAFAIREVKERGLAIVSGPARTAGMLTFDRLEALASGIVDRTIFSHPGLPQTSLIAGFLEEHELRDTQNESYLLAVVLSYVPEALLAWREVYPIGGFRPPTRGGRHAIGPADLVDGATQTILYDRYERKPANRRACLEHYGNRCDCEICGFNFEEKYGPEGFGLIHVHHIVQLAKSGAVRISPERDLLPVCPNCHLMLHRSPPDGGHYHPRDIKRMLNRPRRRMSR